MSKQLKMIGKLMEIIMFAHFEVITNWISNSVICINKQTLNTNVFLSNTNLVIN